LSEGAGADRFVCGGEEDTITDYNEAAVEYLIDKNGLGGIWTHDLSNASHLSEGAAIEGELDCSNPPAPLWNAQSYITFSVQKRRFLSSSNPLLWTSSIRTVKCIQLLVGKLV
jgi:hypothetical protein